MRIQTYSSLYCIIRGWLLDMRIEGIFRVRLLRNSLFGELIAYLLMLLANGAVLFHYIQSVQGIF